MAGQTINDRLLAARHSLAGQGLAKSVCKATTEEMIGPKKKHLDYLVHCTNEPNVSIPHLANLLIERTQNANWVVVYKSLLTVHHLLAYGNERFMQYLASSNSTFNLSNFLDKGGVQGTVGARIGYDMSPFIRRYAKYLNDKALSYRTVAFDFCKVKRGKEEGSLRSMNADKLLKTLPVLQAQLDGLLEFDCQANDLTNGVINMCFMLLFRDLIRLFACYNDGIINLLEKYFDMNKKQCKDALDLYKKFLVRMDKVGEFLKVAENVGIDKGDIPDLTKAPSSLLEALEGHLASLEGKKGSAANTPTQSSSNQKNVKSGVSALSSTSSSFGTAAASARFDQHANGIDESVKAQALAEEEAAMNQYRQTKLTSPTGGSGAAAATNPFLSSPTQPTNIVDLFGGTGDTGGQHQQNAQTKASDDLLQLGNPFADMFGSPAPPQMGGTTVGQPANNNNMWMSNGKNNFSSRGFNGTSNIAAAATGQQTSNTFVSESNFSSVFGAAEPAGTYYLQAATDTTMPNPFLLTDNTDQSQQQQQHQGDFQYSSVSGGGSGNINVTGNNGGGGSSSIVLKNRQPPQRPGPPQRPPPPQTNTTTITSSPLHKISSPLSSSPKSAFDDLNESIRAALGGSPSKQQTMTIGSAGGNESVGHISSGGGGNVTLMVGQQQEQYSSGFVGGQQYQPQHHQQQTIYASPSKQQQQQIGLGFDALGDVLKPSGPAATAAGSVQSTGNVLASGVGQQQQQQMHQQSSQASTGKVLTGDLDSSLASLAENLTINKSASAQVKGVQWNSPKNAAKPASWTPQPMAATTGAGYRPMAQGMTISPAPSTLHHPFVHAPFPATSLYQQQQGMPMRPPPMVAPGTQPMMQPGMMAPMGMMQQQPGGMMGQQQQPPSQVPSADQNGKNIQLDPFGAF